ncbi:MAG: HAMP domain-containing sensor histidine kinase [Eubacteriales bacterium]|nr:HAMP domain-containing sensor histidine kinase [Eubacteriales bacterium]
MKSKGVTAQDRLVRKERMRITFLVLGTVLVFLLAVGIFVPLSQSNSLRKNSYQTLDSAVTRAINAEYGSASRDSIHNEAAEDMFIVLTDEDGSHWETGESDEHEKLFSKMTSKPLDSSGKSDYLLDGYYYRIYSYDYIKSNLSLEKTISGVGSAQTSSPIWIPPEIYAYAALNRSQSLSTNTQFTTVLLIALAGGFLLMSPIVYRIAGLVIRPTKDTLKKEREFVANASHELKTPLAIITADAELLRDKHPEEEDKYNNIVSQCKNMNETVLDMIQLSRLETDERTELEKVNFSKLLMNLCLSFDGLAYEHGIDYSYDIEKDIVLPSADRKNLTRLVNLLLDNAMKYTDNERIIKVTLRKEKRGAFFQVYNTGCEVPDEDREKVFERFYQGKSGSEKERKGSGLGLAIVKNISDRYGYQVEITSHYHKDMAFTLHLK